MNLEATEYTEDTEPLGKIGEEMAVNSFADKLVKKIFGSSSDIFLKKTHPIVEQINALEPSIEKLSDDELKAQTPKFKERIKTALANSIRARRPRTGWTGLERTRNFTREKSSSRPKASSRAGDPARASSRSVRDRARSFATSDGHAPLRRADDRRHRASPGTYR
jgi:hypothetical protein